MGTCPRLLVLALKEIPATNASIEGRLDRLSRLYLFERRGCYAQGLVMPVLRNAEAMRFLAIKTGIAEHGKEARLAIEDIAGGSFTMFVFSLLPSGTCGVELAWFITARVVTSSVVCSARQLSTCLKLLYSACTPSRTSPSFQRTDHRSPNHGRRADILP